ncbi:hypothetical protein D3C83_100020 [compost metagenome]
MAKNATRSLRFTFTSAMPSEAMRPISAGRRCFPAARTGTPTFKSSPAPRTFWPFFWAGGTTMRFPSRFTTS